MRAPAERVWFAACAALGWLLRSARYATVRIDDEDRVRLVRKRRLAHAPLLIAMSRPLAAVLDTGVRVLPHREWVERERQLHRCLRGASVRVEADGTLVLPYLAGEPLAALLDDPALAETERQQRAIAGAVEALAALHRRGITHGDAMADNVIVDRAAGVSHWFDFETVHDARRPMAWRRADDLRALLTTVLARTAPGSRAATLQRMLDAYGDEEVVRELAASVAPVLRRPLAFHLGQAALSYRDERAIARLVRERSELRATSAAPGAPRA
ncbi:hypothetical protein [Roseisolibacter agri]|uniref:hypothetical protein n=1 Tax=Roseisolibacter agri TaxID=2014610 RepID=UPI0024E123BF|nr:hypothetical protein [Roseisolibacter agri]